MNGGSTLCKSTIPNLWKKSEPNGDRIENCVVIEYDFIDVDCNYKACGACEIDKTIVFAMRGLCKNSKFDVHYGLIEELSYHDKYAFRGFADSFLYWDHQNKYWKLEGNYTDSSVYAISNNTVGPYPIGTNKWYFFNDNTACITEKNKVGDNIYVEEINFSSCSESMFNCYDGTW